MRFVLIVLFGLFASVSAAQADNLTGRSKQERADVLRFSINNSLFTLYHEMAHLLIDELDLPVLGREEDAADYMATWFMLEKKSPDVNRALEDAVKGWLLTAQIYSMPYMVDDYLAGYSPDRHRAYSILCLLVGADGANFRKLANSLSVGSDRQYQCSFTYDDVQRSMSKVLREAEGKSEVEVIYRPAGRPLRTVERLLRSSGVLEAVADDIASGFKLTRNASIVAQKCGEPNAFYDQEDAKVIFCYELLEEFMQSYKPDLAQNRNQR